MGSHILISKDFSKELMKMSVHMTHFVSQESKSHFKIFQRPWNLSPAISMCRAGGSLNASLSMLIATSGLGWGSSLKSMIWPFSVMLPLYLGGCGRTTSMCWPFTLPSRKLIKTATYFPICLWASSSTMLFPVISSSVEHSELAFWRQYTSP